jgi:hypothetical protein
MLGLFDRRRTEAAQTSSSSHLTKRKHEHEFAQT